MNEELLYYLWQHRLYNLQGLATTDGEPLIVSSPGQRNTDSGPDFSNARIQVGDIQWAGNVEIHVKTSDWYKHGHQTDPAFDKLILHVVYENDLDDKTPGNSPILELKGRVDESLIERYRQLQRSLNWIPCENLINNVDDLTLKMTLDRMAVERLERKTEDVNQLLQQNTGSWEETMYQLTARNFGLRTNRDTFELLARSLPQKIISKHKSNLLQIEALLFGQSGLLQTVGEPDEYVQQLQKEYGYLQKLYKLTPLQAHQWKFMRMRPAAFPTVRLAQFAALLHCSSHLFSKIIDTVATKALKEFFNVTASVYWETHYRFSEPSKKRKKELGDSMQQLLLINLVAPMLFAYGNYKGDQNLRDRALELLDSLKPEKNSLIDRWADVRYKAETALETQALIQLKTEHCDTKDCLHCTIGGKLMRPMALQAKNS